MTSDTFRKRAAEHVLYDWACAVIPTETAAELLEKLKYDVDLNQPDIGNVIYGADEESGLPVRFEI